MTVLCLAVHCLPQQSRSVLSSSQFLHRPGSPDLALLQVGYTPDYMWLMQTMLRNNPQVH